MYKKGPAGIEIGLTFGEKSVCSCPGLLQSFSKFQIGILFEVITCCMVPSNMTFWHDFDIKRVNNDMNTPQFIK